MEAPRCRLCGERHWPAVACRIEATTNADELPEVRVETPLIRAPEIYPADPGPLEPEQKPKKRGRPKGPKKRKGRGKQNAIIRRRLHAVQEIEKLGGVNLKGVHCPTCTCRSKRLHTSPATRQSVYRMRRRMLKAHQEVAPPPPVPEPDPSCG